MFIVVAPEYSQKQSVCKIMQIMATTKDMLHTNTYIRNKGMQYYIACSKSGRVAHQTT